MTPLEEAMQALAGVYAPAAPEQVHPMVYAGQKVITWHTADENAIVWMGEDPDDPARSLIRLNIGLRSNNIGSHIYCPYEDVAPAGTPLVDAKDPRIDIQNLPKPGPWLPGRWRLNVPMNDGRTHEKWFRTKREAYRYGQVWLTVLDFHNAVAESTTDPWKELIDAMSELGQPPAAAAPVQRQATKTGAHFFDSARVNSSFQKHKRALSRAVKTGVADKVTAACRAAVREWEEIGAWPDRWSDWQRALDDALGWRNHIDLRDLAAQ
jgi:hypothetical protein